MKNSVSTESHYDRDLETVFLREGNNMSSFWFIVAKGTFWSSLNKVRIMTKSDAFFFVFKNHFSQQKNCTKKKLNYHKISVKINEIYFHLETTSYLRCMYFLELCLIENQSSFQLNNL